MREKLTMQHLEGVFDKIIYRKTGLICYEKKQIRIFYNLSGELEYVSIYGKVVDNKNIIEYLHLLKDLYYSLNLEEL